MISYDDLVVALAAWRARQGLPVVQIAGSVAPARPAAEPSAPLQARSAPPGAPPRPGARPVVPETQDFEDSALVEESPYDGDEYVVESGEATAIGDAPEPATDGLLVPKRGKRPDW
jgi:hypothetical protein